MECECFQSTYEIWLFHHVNVPQEVFSVVLSCRTLDFSPVTKAGSAAVGRAAFLGKKVSEVIPGGGNLNLGSAEVLVQ